MKLYDGQAAVIATGGFHFGPYGLNYDQEGDPAPRVRHVRIVSAMRFDMGIVKDSDGDGLRDDWEMFHFAGLGQSGSADFDGDGITHREEHDSDLDPKVPSPLMDGHRYLIRCQLLDRVVTASGDGAVLRAADGSAEQEWTARSVGGGFFTLSGPGGLLLGMPGTELANDIPVQRAADANALRQQWRAANDASTRNGYYALSNRETGRVLDATAGDEATVLKQYSLTGGKNVPQQYWGFEDLTPDAGSDSDAGAADAGAALDPGAQDGGAADGGATGAGDGGTSAAGDASTPAPTGSGQADAGFTDTRAGDSDSSGGCTLGGTHDTHGSAPALGYTLALLGLALRRRRARREG